MLFNTKNTFSRVAKMREDWALLSQRSVGGRARLLAVVLQIGVATLGSISGVNLILTRVGEFAWVGWLIRR